MAQINLSDWSTPELRHLSHRIDKEIERRLVAERQKVLKEMKGLAAGLGMTVHEVLQQTAGGKTRGRAKYRNPDDPQQTWTGRGKRPSWIKEAIERGRSLEDLKIQDFRQI